MVEEESKAKVKSSNVLMLEQSEAQLQTEYKSFISRHSSQLLASSVPTELWHSLFVKLTTQTFDSGSSFVLHQSRTDEEEGGEARIPICLCCGRESHDCLAAPTRATIGKKFELVASADLTENCDIWLVDHCWTTSGKLHETKMQLARVPGLLERMWNSMMVDKCYPDTTIDENERFAKAEEVYQHLWPYVHSFTLTETANEGDQEETQQEIFFSILDEVGSSITHAHSSNTQEVSCAWAPFIFFDGSSPPSPLPFTLLWPVRSIDSGEIITTNFFERFIPCSVSTNDPTQLSMWKDASLFPWVQTQDVCDRMVSFWERSQEERKHYVPAPYASTSALESSNMEYNAADSSTPLTLFSDLPLVANCLKRFSPDRYVVLDSIQSWTDPDILWLAFTEFKQFSSLLPTQHVNRFQQEVCLTFKHLLVLTVRRFFQSRIPPNWFPVSYAFGGRAEDPEELPCFVGDWLHRAMTGMDNTWIAKPANNARSKNIVISTNLIHLIRLSQSQSLVISKYIHNPCLFQGRKFDLRYIVLLQSSSPLRLALYKRFWPRVANKPFVSDPASFSNFEVHFTTYNYTPEFFKRQTQFTDDDFTSMFEDEHDVKWSSDIQPQIEKAIYSLFFAAASQDEEHSLIPDGRSRAMYGVDVILSSTSSYQPVILEVNFSPDCTRACQWEPEYFVEVFDILFRNDLSKVTLLSGN